MATKTILLGPRGDILKRPWWDKLKEQSGDPWLHHEYDNGKFAIYMRAVDRIHTDGAAPAEHWKRFKVDTFIIVREDFEGNPLPKPKYVEDIDASGTYRTFDEAEKAYQFFLARYTESAFNTETGEFQEQGNLLNPDRPRVVETASTKAVAEDFGSW